MKIIDIGTVIDNDDPQHIGRIRYVSYDSVVSTLQAQYKGPKWDKKDPFVALPFLPRHLSIIPQKNSAVKIIKHVADSEGLITCEYMPGPFTTSHDFDSQQFSNQVTYTNYGVGSIPNPDIKKFSNAKNANEDGFVNPKSVGTMARNSDIAIHGMYGSDVLLTESGVQLRAGKFVSKQTNSKSTKQKLGIYPLRGRKEAKLSMKKFPYTAKLSKQTSSYQELQKADLNHVIEYSINDFINPTQVTIDVYKITTPEGTKYRTDYFDESTELSLGSSKLLISEVITVTSIDDAIAEIRYYISNLDTQKMNETIPSLLSEFAHPFYFRPSNSLKALSTEDSAKRVAKRKLLENIIHNPRTTRGLYFSVDNPNPELQTKSKSQDIIINKHVVLDNNGKKIREDYYEETLSSLITDKFFLLSTETNGSQSTGINFNDLTKYELDQVDYYKKIDPIVLDENNNEIHPNTYAMVRGDKLIELLELMIEMLLHHSHGIVTEPYWPEEETKKIQKIKENLRTDMINKSLRIN
jgi:hypothetical protein